MEVSENSSKRNIDNLLYVISQAGSVRSFRGGRGLYDFVYAVQRAFPDLFQFRFDGWFGGVVSSNLREAKELLFGLNYLDVKRLGRAFEEEVKASYSGKIYLKIFVEPKLKKQFGRAGLRKIGKEIRRYASTPLQELAKENSQNWIDALPAKERSEFELVLGTLQSHMSHTALAEA